MSKRRRSCRWKEISKAQEDLLNGKPITITMKSGKLRRIVKINSLAMDRSCVEVIMEPAEDDLFGPSKLRINTAQKVQVWFSVDDIR